MGHYKKYFNFKLWNHNQKRKEKVSLGFLSKEQRKKPYITIIHLSSNTDIQEMG